MNALKVAKSPGSTDQETEVRRKNICKGEKEEIRMMEMM